MWPARGLKIECGVGLMKGIFRWEKLINIQGLCRVSCDSIIQVIFLGKETDFCIINVLLAKLESIIKKTFLFLTSI